MSAIYDIVIAKPSLPSRFISKAYDHFLFFDIDIRRNYEFFDVLQGLAGKNIEICIFYSQTLLPLGETLNEERWADKVNSVVNDLEAKGDCFGLIIVERNGSWVIAQDMPVNWGVFGLKGVEENALKLFNANAINRDWFLSIEHFKQAIADPTSSMHDSFDLDFINSIIANYG